MYGTNFTETGILVNSILIFLIGSLFIFFGYKTLEYVTWEAFFFATIGLILIVLSILVYTGKFYEWKNKLEEIMFIQ